LAASILKQLFLFWYQLYCCC